jgi:hypothetical protein
VTAKTTPAAVAARLASLRIESRATGESGAIEIRLQPGRDSELIAWRDTMPRRFWRESSR